jgi:DNA ligase-associated metallophosphoesterase
MTDRVATVAGETLTLLPERAAFWDSRSTLFVADLHFGKAATFRALGVPVPRGTTSSSLSRLDAMLARTHASRLVFLGDFLHAREGRDPETLRVINEWRSARRDVDMILVRGNHDVRAGDPPRELDVRCVDAPMVDGPFVFDHHPRASAQGYVLCGHIHPGARLNGPARQSVMLPCFWFGESVGVLPAFGEFTGLAQVEPEAADQVFVAAEGEVVRVR